MPRKAKRDEEGKRSPWFSEKTEIAHEGCAAKVRTVGGCGADGAWSPNTLNALVQHYFWETGYIFRYVPDADGGGWLKARIRGVNGEAYYLLVAQKQHDAFTSAFLNLCEKVEEMEQGYLRPSKDIFGN